MNAAFAKSIREFLAAGRATLRAQYAKHPQVDRNLRAHSALVDEAITRIATYMRLPATFAIAATGGYGRNYLFPASDVDLIVLLPTAANAAETTAIEAFVSLLWDAGLEPGIAVRTVAESLEEAKKDVTVDTALLETRTVWGNQTLVHELVQALAEARELMTFFDAKIAEHQRRHARHNDVALNLEPNIKESPGGLRDLQTVMWLARAGNLGADWVDLASRGLITHAEAAFIARHRRVLVDLRIRLHYLAGRREDRLVFDHQHTLATELKLVGSHHRSPAEVLMQRYYLSAKAVWQMCEILIPTLRECISGKAPTLKRIDGEFDLVGGNIAAHDIAIFSRDTNAIFRAFRALQRVPEAEFFAPDTLRALWRAAPSINSAVRRDPVANQLFLEILQGEKVTFTLRRMSRFGVLGRFIPAFGRIVGQMQHDLFHVYTVDEHILMVLRNMRRLVLPKFAHEFPFCHQLAKDFERPEVLYLATLFHDIAKGRGGDHSALGKVDARRFCKRLNLSRVDTDLVAWLVETHLQMSATAQKQDLSDIDVLAAFAGKVRTERRLVALYLLTVADIRGTSPHVWNTWKGKLLEQLFRATQKLLRGESVDNATWIANKKAEALVLCGFPAGYAPAHWQQAGRDYFQRFDAWELAQHATMLQPFENIPTVPLVQATSTDAGDAANLPDEGLTVVVITPDQPGLFARITGYFEHLSFDIAAARIFTTADGTAFDTFHVLPKRGIAIRDDRLARKISAELAHTLQSPLATPPRSSGRIARQVKHFPIAPQVGVRAIVNTGFHELAVTCADRPGLLSLIARVLLEHDISLHDARIATLGQRAEDMFVVQSDQLEEPAFVAAFCTTLEEAIQPK